MRKKLLIAAAVVGLLGSVFALVLWNRMQRGAETAQAGAAGGDASQAAAPGTKNDEGKPAPKKAGSLADKLSAPAAPAAAAAGKRSDAPGATAGSAGPKSGATGSAWGDPRDDGSARSSNDTVPSWTDRFKSAWAQPADKSEGAASAGDAAAGADSGATPGVAAENQGGGKKSWADFGAKSRIDDTGQNATPPKRSILDVGDDAGENETQKGGVAAEAKVSVDDFPRKQPFKSGAAGAFPIDDRGPDTAKGDDRRAATGSSATAEAKTSDPFPSAARSGASPAAEPAPGAERFPSATVAPRYIARSDDSFWLIAKRLYGSGDYYEALYEHNKDRHRGIADLKEGDLVETPSIDELRRLYPSLCPAAAEKSGTSAARIAERSDPPATERTTRPDRSEWQPKALAADNAAPPDAKTPIDGPRAIDPAPAPRAIDQPAAGGLTSIEGQQHYVVGKGDTLFNIARRLLGKATRWVEIYELNRDVLGDDVDLRPGLELRLPEDGLGENSAARPDAAGPPR
ncbi:MAG: LysM peptidoglycan-binding domain-containing protein [Planctomycetia bacterium]|nr:LysM peptidoglycan-binding domain-containing protein [Planctomycetia bacterium]